MPARAIWKGVLNISDLQVPVKLYSALIDRSVHFRLLHRRDQAPVQQIMVNAKTGKPVPFEETQKAYRISDDECVILTHSELEELEPEKSRTIEVSEFLPKSCIDYRWYDRPYFLSPDGDEQVYLALAHALEKSQKLGLAHWVMRDKEYAGALTLYKGYPILITLRYAEQVMPLSQLRGPQGEPLPEKEQLMARQLINMLGADFRPERYHDEYRHRVMDLIKRKQQGKEIEKIAAKQHRPSTDLNRALRESLQRTRA